MNFKQSLKPEIQTRLLHMFFHSLGPKGYLFLGSSETIGELSDGYETVDSKWKIYKPVEGFSLPALKETTFFAQGTQEPDITLPTRGRQFEGHGFEKVLDGIIAAVMPPSILIDAQDNILHIINDTSRFIKLSPGKFSPNLIHNLPPELALFVSAHLRKLKKNDKTLLTDHLYDVRGFEDNNIILEGRVIETGKTTFYLLSFIMGDKLKQREKVTSATVKRDVRIRERMLDLEKELQFTKESLQATVEELETSNEELQSSNEELIASNEELQSTNEELQSVNEELYTVNSEYQNKIEELTRLNGDMNNLLRNTDVGALYLDQKLCIRKITPLVTKITNIMNSDIGRPITHISVMEGYPTLRTDAGEVLQNLKPLDREISTTDGLTFYTRIRPYRTENNSVDGVLLTFVDITELRHAEKAGRNLNERLSEVLRVGNMAWWEWDIPSGKVIFDDRKATMIGYTPEEFPGDVMAICNLIHPDDYEKTMQFMRDHLEGRSPAWDATYRIRRKDGGYAWYYDRGRITDRDENGQPLRLVGSVMDISKIKGLEEEIGIRRDFLDKLLDDSPMAKLILNREGRIIYANKSAEAVLGLPIKEITTRDFNSAIWEISDKDECILEDKDHPFMILKTTGKPVFNRQISILRPDKKRIKLTLTGAPLIGHDEEFEGCLFNIGVIKHGKEKKHTR